AAHHARPRGRSRGRKVRRPGAGGAAKDRRHPAGRERHPARPHSGVIGRAFALLVAGPFRFLVIAAAAFTCLLAYLYLPAISRNEGTPMAVAPPGSRAVSTEQRAAADFGLPFFSDIVIVQRDPHGLGTDAARRAVDRAALIDQGELKASYPRILGAIPLVNQKNVVPASKESGTTAVTLLQVDPTMSLYGQYRLAQRYVREQVNRPDDHVIGITGAVPARALQGDLIDQSLPLVELASVAVIFLLITIRFRAPGAGLLTLGASGLAYFLSSHVVAWAAVHYGLDIPVELQPLLVVLVLAVVTDYSVFLLAGTRSELAEGERSSAAARIATANYTPIILVAALTVAGSAASLAVAGLEFLRVLGPALGVSVMVSAAVALTTGPAALASFGRWILWPGLRGAGRSPHAAAAPTDPGPLRRAVARLQSIRLVAFGRVGRLRSRHHHPKRPRRRAARHRDPTPRARTIGIRGRCRARGRGGLRAAGADRGHGPGRVCRGQRERRPHRDRSGRRPVWRTRHRDHPPPRRRPPATACRRRPARRQRGDRRRHGSGRRDHLRARVEHGAGRCPDHRHRVCFDGAPSAGPRRPPLSARRKRAFRRGPARIDGLSLHEPRSCGHELLRSDRGRRADGLARRRLQPLPGRPDLGRTE